MKYYIMKDENGDYTNGKDFYNVVEVSQVSGPLAEEFLELTDLEAALEHFRLTERNTDMAESEAYEQ